MGKYLKEFELTSQYEEYINSTMALLPNVSLTNDNNVVHYNPYVIPNYLTFTAEKDNSTISLSSANDPDIKYSLNGGEWTQWDYSAITLNTGDAVRMKGNNSNGFNTNSYPYNQFQMTGKIGASGNITSLLYEDNFEGKLTIPCDHCYQYMFYDCTSLTTAPELPATTLTKDCYGGMFNGCTSLTTAPELPATTLAERCYNNMFADCTSLTTAPTILPATTLAEYCYSNMFVSCTSLTTVPTILPATTLAEYCYSDMFYDCTSLTTAPKLPATTLAEYCYSNMFCYCDSLTTVPTILPATTLAERCYNNMFEGCTSLTTAPELPATTLAEGCYNGMFNGCTSLTTAPELPAYTLAESCYSYMFYDCSSLTTAPELFADDLVKNCYAYMFGNCHELNYIKMLATNMSGGAHCLDSWLAGVASTGTFIKDPNMTLLPSGSSGIPEGWTVQDAD